MDPRDMLTRLASPPQQLPPSPAATAAQLWSEAKDALGRRKAEFETARAQLEEATKREQETWIALLDAAERRNTKAAAQPRARLHYRRTRKRPGPSKIPVCPCGRCGHSHSADSDGGPGPCRNDECDCMEWVGPSRGER